MAKKIDTTPQDVWDSLNAGVSLRKTAKHFGIDVRTASKLRDSRPDLKVESRPGPVPISSGKKKAAPKPGPTLDPMEELRLKVPDVQIPKGFAKASPKSLATGAYQRKLLAVFAPVVMPELMNSIRRSIHCGSAQAQRLAADILGLTPKNPGVSLSVSQNNLNQGSVDASEGRRSVGPTTPDEMYRQLAAEREQRKIAGRAVIDLVATPIGEYEEDVKIQPVSN